MYLKRRIFLGQLKGFNSCPEVFKLYSFLDMMTASGSKSRKYILSDSLGKEVIQLNLEKKLKSRLLDLNLGDESPEQ